ncbi:hypothetical protein M0R04_06565 [Candidatus Dojkabacteria bacterium]|jgi:hypothetical protein|nr:hypothetical protein [Candidatus Dojkabacteria bacterium]
MPKSKRLANPEIIEEVENPTLYSKYIKDKCSICPRKIEKSWQWYSQHGNLCAKCHAKTSKLAEKNKFRTGIEFGLKD